MKITARTEMEVNLCLFLFGFFISLIFALLPTEARWITIMIAIGGAICTVGLFLSVASLIGVIKNQKSIRRTFAGIYTRSQNALLEAFARVACRHYGSGAILRHAPTQWPCKFLARI